ncbi:hypothetical protein BUALT_Bualt14G0102500 [Buddleja alternifolia]|uniref:Uncharacterized protein n=1 Tax=Buddleja alternifolia TaxID=168488 RepID=A0AAV6WJN0_9LAMI|nr:hypothetical protein BUALT_Bualt14G0102500 [Buddleja alternifolia]
MYDELANRITIEMDHMICGLPSKPSKPFIFKVDHYLRSYGREDIYNPQILAIGPYHHQKSSLQNMEKHKYRYLKQLLKRQSEQSVDRYIIAMTKMEKRARKCYVGPLDLNENEFVKMLVLDGCFLIELLRCHRYRSLRDEDDPLFKHDMMLIQLQHDIMLIENQLPFFVLNELFNMTKQADVSERTCTLMDIQFVNGVLRIPRLNIFDETESHFKNLIAYEQYFAGARTRYVSDYTFFMHCLINSSDDVKLLRFTFVLEGIRMGKLIGVYDYLLIDVLVFGEISFLLYFEPSLFAVCSSQWRIQMSFESEDLSSSGTLLEDLTDEAILAQKVTINIHREIELDELTPSISSRPFIFKVGGHLRGEDGVYDPRILAVGPYYHYNKPESLENMEKAKRKYVKQLLRRKNEESVHAYVRALVPMEQQARDCYAETFALEKDDFLKLLILDGFFLIELFRNYHSRNLRGDADDPIFRLETNLSLLRRDIFLVENQLLFFVLNHLFNMTKIDEEEDLIALILHFVDGMFLNLSASRASTRLSFKNIDHLCGLIHEFLCFPFQKATGNENFMDISFVDGVLIIPQLSVFDETESQLRNLATYEQYLAYGEHRYVSDYMCFMHHLMNSSNDAQLLCNRGIIKNWLGDDEDVCFMFNRIGQNILTSPNFGYSQVFCNVNDHCRRRAKKWTANLCRTYFNSPWSIISLIAAAALVLFTGTATVFTTLSYFK